MIEDQLWPVFGALCLFALLGTSIAYMVRTQRPRWRVPQSQYRNIVELAKLDEAQALRDREDERERRRRTCPHDHSMRLNSGHRLCTGCALWICACCKEENATPGDAA